MSIRIAFSDVDGTIVDTNHHALPADGPTLRRVTQRIPLCLVSGRSPEGIYSVQRALGITGPIAAFSGAYVLDEKGEELYSKTIPLDLALEVKAYLESDLPNVVAGTYGFHKWIVDDARDSRVLQEEYFVQTRATQSRDLKGTFGKRGIHKFLLMGEPDAILSAESTLGARYPELTVVRSNDVLCEVMAAGVSKSHAVDVLCHHFGASRGEAVAFGDGPNDLDMLLAVDESYAMPNGEPSVREAAAHVCEWSNLESGVAKTLARLVLGEEPGER